MKSENKKSSKKKKLIAALGALAVLGTGGVGTTLAYLSDSEQHTNVITIGDAKVELEEPAYTALSKAAKTNVVPNEELPKNPFIRNTGVNDAIVFMKVTVPVENVSWIADDGTVGTKKNQEIFFFKDSTDLDSYHGNHFDVNSNTEDSIERPANLLSDINIGISPNRITGNNQVTGRWIELTTLEKNVPANDGTQAQGSRTYIFGFSQPLKGYADSEAQKIWTAGEGAANAYYGSTNTGNNTTGTTRGLNVGANDEIQPLNAIEAGTVTSSDSRDTINGTKDQTITEGNGKNFTGTGLDGSIVDGNIKGNEVARSVAAVWNTSSLFEKIQVKNVLEDELLQGALRKIKIEAFAIQANDIILSATGEHNSFPATQNMTKPQLTEIYQIFMNQSSKATKISDNDKDNGNTFNPDAKVKEADSGNKNGLGGVNGETNVAPGTYAGADAEVVDTSTNTESGD